MGGACTGHVWGVHTPGVRGGPCTRPGGVHPPGMHRGCMHQACMGVHMPGVHGGSMHQACMGGPCTGHTWGVHAPGMCWGVHTCGVCGGPCTGHAWRGACTRCAWEVSVIIFGCNVYIIFYAKWWILIYGVVELELSVRKVRRYFMC